MSYCGSDVACHLQKQLNKNNVLDWKCKVAEDGHPQVKYLKIYSTVLEKMYLVRFHY